MSALPVEVPSSKAAPADADTMTRRPRSRLAGAAERSPRGPAEVANARRHAGQLRPVRVLSPGRDGGERNERRRPLPAQGWALPEKEWLLPDGDRLFPGGGRVFTGGTGVGQPLRTAPAGAPRAGVSRQAGVSRVGVSRQPMRLIRPAAVTGVPPRPVRLTHRGRVVVAIVGVLVAAGAFVAAATAAQATSGSAARSSASGAEKVIVRPGDTLWSIARSADPGADTRTIVQRILQANRISGASIMPGQSLLVPRG